MDPTTNARSEPATSTEPAVKTGSLAEERDLNPCALGESRGKRANRLSVLVADGPGFPAVLAVAVQVAHACAVVAPC